MPPVCNVVKQYCFIAFLVFLWCLEASGITVSSLVYEEYQYILWAQFGMGWKFGSFPDWTSAGVVDADELIKFMLYSVSYTQNVASLMYNVGLHTIILIFLLLNLIMSSINIATSYRFDAQEVRIQFPAWTRDFSLLHGIQTCSVAHSASYLMCTVVSYPSGKAVGSWSWPLTSISCWGYIHSHVFMAWCLIN
jgi:hypothetical protein